MVFVYANWSITSVVDLTRYSRVRDVYTFPAELFYKNAVHNTPSHENIGENTRKTTFYTAHFFLTKWKKARKSNLKKTLSISFPKWNQDWRQTHVNGSGRFRNVAPFMCFQFVRSLLPWCSSRSHSRHQDPEFHLASVFCCSSSQ